MKTATEVISENSKTFGTVKAHENNLRDALTDMVHAIFDLAIRYGLTWEGVPVEQLVADGYSVSVGFDDSIIQDRDAEINQGVMLTSSGLMSKKRFMMDTLGLTDEQAEAELAQIQREGTGSGIDITRLYGGME